MKIPLIKRPERAIEITGSKSVKSAVKRFRRAHGTNEWLQDTTSLVLPRRIDAEVDQVEVAVRHENPVDEAATAGLILELKYPGFFGIEESIADDRTNDEIWMLEQRSNDQ